MSSLDSRAELRAGVKMAPKSQKNLSGAEAQNGTGHNLSEVVHDLNNVLYAMAGFVEIAIEDLPKDHPAREALVEAARASDSAATLVGKLLPDQPAAVPPPPRNSNAIAKPKALSSRRVLVIEEEPMVAELLERALKRFGFEPRVFVDAQHALDKFAAAPDDFDAIVTDEATPNAMGLEVVMKMQEMRPRLPVILMTAGNKSILTSRALEAGIQHVMHKPVKIQELCRTLEELTLTIVD